MRSITSGSVGSIPNAKAGKLSVIKLTHNKWIGNSGTPKSNDVINEITEAPKIVITSPILLDNKNWTSFLILSNIPRPSLIEVIIVAKLSSVKIILAAPLATSVPVIPIAQPISAVFKAGESLTPSPVIATILPLDFHALTILTLCSGATLAYTEYSSIWSANCTSDIFSSSLPITAFWFDSKIPKFRAIALAVITWSPVIIIVLTPAFLASAIACFASWRGGSIIPTIPIKVKLFSTNSLVISSGSSCQ